MTDHVVSPTYDVTPGFNSLPIITFLRDHGRDIRLGP